MRRLLLLTCIVAACHSRHRPAYEPKMYPYRGFGAVGCFAGPSLNRFAAAVGAPNTETLSRGPWLVLDSLVGIDTAWRRAGEPASFVERRDSLTSNWGDWQRIRGDSITIAEGTFPSVQWRFHVENHQLRGEGILRSDVVRNGYRAVDRWPVWLLKVPCTSVPLTAPSP